MKNINQKFATTVNKIKLLELYKMKFKYCGGGIDLRSEKFDLIIFLNGKYPTMYVKRFCL